MNYIFVFSIGILTGTLFAFEVFQKQLETIIDGKKFIADYDWVFHVKKEEE